MRKAFILAALICPVYFAYQEPGATESKPAGAATAPAAETGSKPQELDPQQSESRKNTKAMSLRELKEADERMSKEREEIAKRERRLAQLLEEMKNQDTTLTGKEARITGILNAGASQDSEFKIPDKLLAHYESRDPKVAAKDFVILYKEDPKVAMALVKNMKKKKSALLIDEISKTADGGKEIAAKIHEAIGTGGPRKEGG